MRKPWCLDDALYARLRPRLSRKPRIEDGELRIATARNSPRGNLDLLSSTLAVLPRATGSLPRRPGGWHAGAAVGGLVSTFRHPSGGPRGRAPDDDAGRSAHSADDRREH